MHLDSSEIKKLFATRLKLLRARKGYSTSKLAELSGVSQPYLSQIESGKKYPSMEKMAAIAEALGVEINELLHQTGDKNLKKILKNLLSEDFKHFPLIWFGFEREDLVSLLMDNPAQAEGLFDILNDLMRLHNISRLDIVHAAIRAYRRRDQRFLLQLESEARLLRKTLGYSAEGTIKAEDIHSQLLAQGYIINETVLPTLDKLKGVRFVYVNDDKKQNRPILYINKDLTEAQKTFLFCFEYFHAVKRIHFSRSSRRIDHLRMPYSIEASLNNYKAKYFAEAVMVDEASMAPKLEEWFSQPRWISSTFLSIAQSASVGVFMHRIAVIASRKFGLNNASLVRFTHDLSKEDGEFHVEREQNMSENLPDFLSVRTEHLCRRFAAIKALRKLDAMEGTPEFEQIKADMVQAGTSMQLPVVVHRSRFVGKHDGDFNHPEYLAIAVAYPRRKKRNIAYTLIFEIDDRFKEVVSFWQDPTIPVEFVALSCERCRLKAPPGGRKASHPLVECDQRATVAERHIGRGEHLLWERRQHIKHFINNEELHAETRRLVAAVEH